MLPNAVITLKKKGYVFNDLSMEMLKTKKM